MKVYRPMPIDRTLKALEDIADTKGLKLEDVPGYVGLCEFLTDIEFGDKPRDWHNLERTLKVLKALIAYVAPGWIGCEMEFHRKCQPESLQTPNQGVSCGKPANGCAWGCGNDPRLNQKAKPGAPRTKQ